MRILQSALPRAHFRAFKAALTNFGQPFSPFNIILLHPCTYIYLFIFLHLTCFSDLRPD